LTQNNAVLILAAVRKDRESRHTFVWSSRLAWWSSTHPQGFAKRLLSTPKIMKRCLLVFTNILRHRGEANHVTQQFEKLKREDQAAIMEFLKSL